MSLLRRGEHRRGRVATAATTVALLGAFQVLAIIGAGTASAITACQYNPTTDSIQVSIDPTQSVFLAVETTAADLDPAAPAGAILADLNGAGYLACGSAAVSNTVAITVLGQPSFDELFAIDELSGGTFPSTIAWAVDLGTNTVAGDWFYWWGNDLVDDVATFSNDAFDVNGGVGELNNSAENMWLDGGNGDDTIDAHTVTGYMLLEGGGDDDWLAPGTFDGDDVTGNAGYDTLSYGTRTTCTVVDNGLEAGQDANCDGDLADVTDENDSIDPFEAIETGTGNDSIYGLAAFDEWFIPGDGDDYVEGNAGDDDLIDFSTSSAAMSIDPFAGTATGQGADEYVDVWGFVGSDFDDVLLWNANVWAFAGGAGVDTVDASAKTTAQTIDLDVLDDVLSSDSTENAIGGSGDDTIFGNDLRNRLEGGSGNDSLDGEGGNDTFIGGPGNDAFIGGLGADTIDFASSPAGVTADMSLGFASGDGDDSLGAVEIVKGSAFNDSITGGLTGLGSGINYYITGRAGNDILTGSDSNDTLKGGAGNDKLRGLEGGDTLAGGKGKDKGWGGPGTDVCKSLEKQKSCEI